MFGDTKEKLRRLDRLLRPKSIAFFGGKWAAAAIRQTRKMGYQGEIWPVHPTRNEVEGLPAVTHVEHLPGAPDAAFIAVNRKYTIDIIRALSNFGAGGAICFASGFRETHDGDGLQEDLIAAAGEMPIIGPNCYGFIDYADGAILWPDQHGGERLEAGRRGAAIITQSSNLAINMTMQTRGLPLAYVMTVGNQAQTGISELALGLIEEPCVGVLGLHIEGFDSVAGFERLAARARELQKPIVALKVGRSEIARAAALTHTASLAGSEAVSQAFLRRLGIGSVRSAPVFLETLKLLLAAGPLAGPRLSYMVSSGGEVSIVADSAVGRPVGFPALSEGRRKAVEAALGPGVAVANPLDYHTYIWNDEAAMTATFSELVADDFDLNLLGLDFPRADRCSDAEWWSAVDSFETALKRSGAKGAVLATLPENMPERAALLLLDRGLAPMAGVDEALTAAECAADIGAAWQKPVAAPVAAVSGIIAKADGLTVMLDEAEAKSRLAAAGLPVPPGRRVETADAAVEAALSLGFPVALKALGLAHKSEHGAVRLGLGDAVAVNAAAEELAQLGSGLLVEKMVGGVAELIVGITTDPQFGPVMTVGSGGVLVEIIADSRTLLLPASRDDIAAALKGLRFSPLLDGYRGRPRADLNAAIAAIDGIARFAAAGQIRELDVNPLIVCAAGAGAWIADALIVMEDDND